MERGRRLEIAPMSARHRRPGFPAGDADPRVLLGITTNDGRLTMLMRKIQAMAIGGLLTLGTAVTVYADVMNGTGHLEKQSTACAGPFFIDGANGGFIVRGTSTSAAGEWTVLQSGDCRFADTNTILDVTTNELSQFISVADNPKFFPGCFKLCVTTSNSGTSSKIDYSMTMDSGPF